MIEILHVSDLHFGKNPIQDRIARALLDGIRPKFTGRDNRYLLVTGDITDNGKKSEYDLALEALRPFAPRVFVTPGNHDYGSLSGMDYCELKAQCFDEKFAKILGFTHPFFDKKVWTLQVEDHSDHSTLMMIGLNSCAKEGISDFAQGEVGESQRDELKRMLVQCDPETPKLLFLHHIPNKHAEWQIIMTLRDWEDLMEVVKGRVDALAFGHQGKVMQVGLRGRRIFSEAPNRPMELRTLDMGNKRALVLDANYSVAEQAFYLIKSDGKQVTAKVEYVPPAGGDMSEAEMELLCTKK